MFNIFIIGISEETLTLKQRKLLSSCNLIVGTDRFADLVTDFSARFIAITPLKTAIGTMGSALESGNVAVLASGDPLFYGIGKRLLCEFPKERVQLFPALSALQKACALFKTPWDDAAIISLHGRASHHIPGLLLSKHKSIVFTDGKNSPTQIANEINTYLRLIGQSQLAGRIKVQVAEDLGMESENVFNGDLTTTAKTQFSPLNILCLELPAKPSTVPPFPFGLSEDDIHHSRGLITKNEVRAATLHQLRLPLGGVLWDIGAGSGSISIEAARSVPSLTVYSIEHKEEEIANIKNNIGKYGCYNMVPVFGRAPERLHDLPDPNCVFVGGSSGSLPEIVAYVTDRLLPCGRLVINGVIAKTIEQAPALMAAHGFNVTTSSLNVTRTDQDGNKKDFNPITILTGTR
jgi:precorrin-6Y C5,15-methyltransferase (decarboxylating)